MLHYRQTITCLTHSRGTTNITNLIRDIIRKSKVEEGLVHLFLKHTSASLILCENAAPEVRSDLETFMSQLVKDGDEAFLHTDEGPDDMSAHIRTVLTTNDLTLPVTRGELDVGIWQGIFLWEHRMSSHQREIVISII